MSEKRKTDFSLNRLDDLFTSQSERENGLTPTIKDIPLSRGTRSKQQNKLKRNIL